VFDDEYHEAFSGMSEITQKPFPVSPDWCGLDEQQTRQVLLEYFTHSFDTYESLFECLSGDQAYFEKPIPLRHPLIFYFGHTATFFVNKLLMAKLIPERINPRFEAIFAVGVDEMSWDDLNDAHYDWPAVAEVKAYRDEVRAVVTRIIKESTYAEPMGWDNPWWAILMGVEHELIHLETSSVLIRQHRLDRVRSQPAWAPTPVLPCPLNQAPENSLINVPAGSVQLGKGNPHQNPCADEGARRYGWDNEYGRHSAQVDAFQAGRLLVSNAEFYPFVEAGGYTNHAYWTEEGWGWRNYTAARHPTFWCQRQSGWALRLMCEEVDMPWHWPVEVNNHEATAFCAWKSAQSGQMYRLPTEDEWVRLYDSSEISPETPAQRRRMGGASAVPVDAFQHGDFCDVVGNVWQWTCTPIYPFTGFEAHPLYDDFSIPTFDERHTLIKGGSWISCGNEALRESRYAFRRHFFQHAGFRYVVGAPPVAPVVSRYEDDALLAQYAEFHFGQRYFDVPNFPEAIAHIALDALQDKPRRRALDIGCAVGRTSLELARGGFDNVTGIDFSARFINIAAELVRQGFIRYALTDEGELQSFREASLVQHGLDQYASHASFLQGDACNLKELHRDYDLVVAANLIDRLYDPEKFLTEIGSRIVSGGVLVIASPYTWLEEHTPRSRWLGGYKKDGERYTTHDALVAILETEFEPIGPTRDVPFVIRETARKFQHSVSQVSCWRRR
jgi:5-histidylcysteine sulfoxide synthase/putative 4-mercaptohistidine N1-methyltranferase